MGIEPTTDHYWFRIMIFVQLCSPDICSLSWIFKTGCSFIHHFIFWTWIIPGSNRVWLCNSVQRSSVQPDIKSFVPFEYNLWNSAEQFHSRQSNTPFEHNLHKNHTDYWKCDKGTLKLTRTPCRKILGRSINSDWFVNSFLMLVYENIFSRLLDTKFWLN